MITTRMLRYARNRLLTLALILVCPTGLTQQAVDAINNRPDEPGSGPYPALKEEDPGLPDQVVYRPADLATLGGMKLGVVAWGNGGCVFNGASSRFHLLELASHGYLVIAGGGNFSGDDARPPAGMVNADGSPKRTSYTSLTQAIDWALAENARPGSPYYGKIDTEQVALSGYSCGGVQVNHVAGDPRVKTLVMHNTGLFNEPPPANTGVADMALGKQALADIHTPVIYILGGESDIAYENGMDDYARLEHVPVAVANTDVGHGGTFLMPYGGSAARVAVRWLDWHLRGNREAALYFIGSDCGLCRDPEWTLQRKFNSIVAP